jgi:hypothetical protein
MVAGGWCQLLAERIANTSSIEWTMRVQRSVLDANTPRARFDSGIPMARHQIGAGDLFWFSAVDVAAWLVGMGFMVTHEQDGPHPFTEVTTPEPPGEKELQASHDEPTQEMPAGATDSGPPPVSGPEIAAAFDGIKWGREQWLTALNKGDAAPQWLASARTVRGQSGRRDKPSKWDPVHIASSLVQDGIPAVPPGRCAPTKTQVAAMLRNRFAQVPSLRLWHRQWISHEEMLREMGVIS